VARTTGGTTTGETTIRETGRLEAAGGYLDPSFGTRGTVTIPGGESVALGPGNTIWVLGSVIYTDGVSRYLNRFTASGRRDRTFTAPEQTSNATDLNTGPIVTDPAGGASFAVNICCRSAKPPTSLVGVHTVSAAGKRLPGKAGTATWTMATMVKNPPKDADYVLGGVVRLSDGRKRACVSVYPGASGDPFAALVGFLADGSIDASVGANDTTMPSAGWTKIAGLDDCGFASAGLQQLFVDGTDRLYVVGTATGVKPGAARVIRTTASGVVDHGYGVDGRATIHAATRSYSPLTGVISPDGTLHLGLSSRETASGSSAVATVAKLTTAGARDAGFGKNGVGRFFPAGGSSELDSIGALPGGRVVIGLVQTSGGRRSGSLTAISAASGARVAAFGTRGSVVTNTLTWGTTVQAGNLLTIGSALPADPKAFLGATMLQRRKL
jgi:hypothetical protein